MVLGLIEPQVCRTKTLKTFLRIHRMHHMDSLSLHFQLKEMMISMLLGNLHRKKGPLMMRRRTFRRLEMNKWLILLTVYRLGLSSETRLRLILSPKVVPIVSRKEVVNMMVVDPLGLTMGQEETIGRIDRTDLHTPMGVIAIMVALIVPFRLVVLAVHIKIVSVPPRLMIETLI